ncbi:LptF/LptG family permease [Crocinitomicaceae bacterium]|jgi:lipopolysaccharide export system permease protein|nr:LptF/LptG family permease [Crocinitomicaceae bacterium]MDG1347258.1 LptF/LptG family permease [Crocinitomicaceae bacterium]MDG2465525.1 LptF/LptG family permease [Crocinitomicaceae bacterium]
MLSILDKYIIRKFLSTYFFMLAIIMLLAMVFDIAERMSEFIQNQATIGAIFSEYYLNFLVYYGNTYSSMIVFIAVIWFTAKMAQETEIIPILNSGRPFNRFMRPYMIAATLIMFISLIMNHFILPRSNKVRLDFEERYYRNAHHVEDYHAEYPGNRVVYYSSYNGSDNLINDFVVEKWNDKKRIVYFLKARTAQNVPGTNKWVLNDYYEKHFTNDGDKIIEGRRKEVQYDFTLEDMAARDNVVESLTYGELKKFIKRERSKGSKNIPTFEIELYQRTALPFATYVLTIIGVAVASRKKRGGIGVNIAIGLGITFVYIFAMKVMAVAAVNVGLPSVIAVWVPNVMFAGIAFILYRNAVR